MAFIKQQNNYLIKFHLRVSTDGNRYEHAEHTLSEIDVCADTEITTCDSDAQQSAVGFQGNNESLDS